MLVLDMDKLFAQPWTLTEALAAIKNANQKKIEVDNLDTINNIALCNEKFCESFWFNITQNNLQKDMGEILVKYQMELVNQRENYKKTTETVSDDDKQIIVQNFNHRIENTNKLIEYLQNG